MLRTQIFRITERFSFVPADLVRKTETIKAGARFCKRKFTTQVRHVVVDGGDHRMKGKTDWWEIQDLSISKTFPRWYEREQTRVGVQSVKSWAAEGNLDTDDLFISGNADEVPRYFFFLCVLSWYINI